MRLIRHLALAGLIGLLAACATDQERVPADAPGYINGKAIHPTIKIGKAYRVAGKEYRPKYEPTYTEEGMASWYGPDFHGKSTANGERYNQWAMTAAHRTLPMPSMVKVTNLSNGKAIMVRVNDRGPFSDDRVIDLSRAAAEELEMIGPGTAKVKVEYLKAETENYIAKLKLDKPAEWTQEDIELAQRETIEDLSTKKLPESMAITATDLPAPKHPVELADNVPQRYAFNAPFKPKSTIEARGVNYEETGYAEDAFSVMDDAQHSSYPPAPPTGPPPESPKAEPPRLAAKPQESKPLMKVSFTGKAKQPAVAPAPDFTHSRAVDELARPMTPSPAPKAPIGEMQERYYVQAGSFGSRDNAYRLADKLATVAKVDVSEWPASDKMLYRVRLGPTGHESAAEELIARLRDFGIQDAKIVREQ